MTVAETLDAMVGGREELRELLARAFLAGVDFASRDGVTPQWTPEALDMLGKMTDKAVAAKIGRSVSWVHTKRTSLGIPAHRKHKQRKQQPFLHLLGKVTDSEIARKHGICKERVRQIRKREGIPRKLDWKAGEVIGNSVILGRKGKTWTLKCKCGEDFTSHYQSAKQLRSADPVCQKCANARMQARYVGKKVGPPGSRLTAVRQVSGEQWLFDCDCGEKNFMARLNNVKRGLTKSCGCLRAEYVMRSGAFHPNEGKKLNGPLRLSGVRLAQPAQGTQGLPEAVPARHEAPERAAAP